MHIATQHNICATKQDAAKHSKASLQPGKSEKTKPPPPFSRSIGLKGVCLIGLVDAAKLATRA